MRSRVVGGFRSRERGHPLGLHMTPLAAHEAFGSKDGLNFNGDGQMKEDEIVYGQKQIS